MPVILEFIVPSKKNDFEPFLYSKKFTIVLTVLVLAFNLIISSAFSVATYATSLNATTIIALANEDRVQRGLQSLKSNAMLSAAALAKANNMFEVQYWDHFGPNGETPWQFISAAGYTYYYAGENLAKGFTTSEGVHQAWMASPSHRENILSPNYKDIGVAILSGTLNGKSVTLVVQMFGSQNVSQVPFEEPKAPVKQPTTPIYETGEDKNIKSIKIIYPENGKTYNDRNLDVKGTSENLTESDKIQIIQDGKNIGTVISKDNAWQFDKQSDWVEGENAISADLQGSKSDTVKFNIDSTPPKIIDLTVEEKSGYYEVLLNIDDDNATVKIVSGDLTLNADKFEGVYKALIPADAVKDNVTVVLSDTNFNVDQVDITDEFHEVLGSTDIAGSLISTGSDIPLKKVINIAFAVVIMFIMISEIYFYRKLGMLKERSGNFLMLGLWWLILLFGSFIGFSGFIT